jgi:hypothetical protein
LLDLTISCPAKSDVWIKNAWQMNGGISALYIVIYNGIKHDLGLIPKYNKIYRMLRIPWSINMSHHFPSKIAMFGHFLQRLKRWNRVEITGTS